MTVTPTAARTQKPPPAADLDPDAHAFAGEHALLLRDLGRRTAAVLALAHARTWPAEELHALTRFLRTAVLRQVSDEERLLYPGDNTAAPFAELSTDHLRLHLLTDLHDQVTVKPCVLPQLTAPDPETAHHPPAAPDRRRGRARGPALRTAGRAGHRTTRDRKPNLVPSAGDALITLATLPIDRPVSAEHRATAAQAARRDRRGTHVQRRRPASTLGLDALLRHHRLRIQLRPDRPTALAATDHPQARGLDGRPLADGWPEVPTSAAGLDGEQHTRETSADRRPGIGAGHPQPGAYASVGEACPVIRRLIAPAMRDACSFASSAFAPACRSSTVAYQSASQRSK
jgi:hypothetical protein